MKYAVLNVLCVDRCNTRNRFFQYIQQDLNRIERGKDRHTILNCAAADRYTVFVVHTGKDRTGVDDVAYITGTDGIQDLGAAFTEFTTDTRTDTVIFQEVCGTDRCLDIETEFIETADQRKCFFLILISQRYDDCTIILHLDTRSLHCFEEGTVETLIVADRFTGRLHFR